MKREIILAILQFSFIICSVSERIGHDGVKITCAASAVRMGGEGKILCLFPVDFDLNRKKNLSITILHASKDREVMGCPWDGKFDPSCRIPGDYKVEHHTFELKFSDNVTEADVGDYRCTLMDARIPIGHSENCPLLINGTVPTTSQPSSTEMDLHEQTTGSNNVPGSRSTVGVGKIVAIIFGAVVLVAGVIAAIVVFKWCRRRNRRHRQEGAPHTNDEREMAPPDGHGRGGNPPVPNRWNGRPNQHEEEPAPAVPESERLMGSEGNQGNNGQNEPQIAREGDPKEDRKQELSGLNELHLVSNPNSPGVPGEERDRSSENEEDNHEGHPPGHAAAGMAYGSEVSEVHEDPFDEDSTGDRREEHATYAQQTRKPLLQVKKEDDGNSDDENQEVEQKLIAHTGEEP